MDFEMNQIDNSHPDELKICKNEIIEIGAVKLDDTITKQRSRRLPIFLKMRSNDRLYPMFQSVPSCQEVSIPRS